METKIRYLTKDRERGPFIIINEDNVFNSYGICKFTLTKPASNLNKISIKTNLRKQVDMLPKIFKMKLYYNGKKMKKTKILGEGSYGKVIKYETIEGGELKSVIIKIPTYEIEIEPDILEDYLDRSMCKQHVIPIKTTYDQHDNPFIIMQEANGSLFNLKMDERLIKKCIYQITKAIECFYKHNIFYLDLKTENILYACDNDKISIYLGDIGSFNLLGGEESSAGFPPPETWGKKIMRADKAFMFYTLGALFADFYDLSDDLYFQTSKGKEKTASQFKDKYYPSFVTKIKNSNIPDKIKEIILKLTQKNPTERAKLDFEMIYLLDSAFDTKPL
jgi:serine/threonine protein kinase